MQRTRRLRGSRHITLLLFLLVAGRVAVQGHAEYLPFMYKVCVLGIENYSTLIGHDRFDRAPCFNNLDRATKIHCQKEEHWGSFFIKIVQISIFYCIFVINIPPHYHSSPKENCVSALNEISKVRVRVY